VCVGLAILAIAVVSATAAVAQPRPGQGPPRPILIRDLLVEGNRRVQEAVILGRIQSRPGSPFSPHQLSEDVRNIFGLGFFDDVRTKVEDFEGGVRLTFQVVERPFVRDVEFAGNRRITSDTLREKIDLKLGSVYNPVEVQRAREKLKDYFEEEGYFEVQITPETETFPDGDVKVVFSIAEGRRITIDSVEIRGNRGLTDRKIKEVMAVQERQYFILRGTLQRQKLDEDIERIISLYNDHGYVQARVESTDVAVDRERARVTITIRVMEGPQYTVGKVEITGLTMLPESEVRRQIKLRPGDVFSRSKIRDSIRAIGELYSTIGRASAEVAPRTEQTSADTPRMDLLFEVIEGPEVYVERINIAGNVRSQDKILRREIQLAEGDLFTLQKMQRSRQRLVNLGFFETVNVNTAPGSDKTRIIVNVDVVERPTGIFSIGGGFSSVDSFLGTIDLSQRNFLGRGWEVSVRLRGGLNTQQGIISFTEPWFLDRPLSVGFDVFDTVRQFDEYDLDSLGATFRVSHPFGDFWRWHAQYRITRDKISDVDPNVPTSLLAEEGSSVTSLVALSLVRDSRDNVVAPTKGGSALLLAETAGLGGDVSFAKFLANVTYFKPIWFDHILSGRAEAGYGIGWSGEDLPVYERFYLGGPNTIRGFKYRHVSPIDDAGVRIGGDVELLGNVEYIVPLPFNIRVAGFFDTGNVYGFGVDFDPTDLRYAAGAGVRWLSPFGPIRIDYGVNLDRRTGEDFGAFHFSVGSPF
jgi:outer membrane protein insertion porin family